MSGKFKVSFVFILTSRRANNNSPITLTQTTMYNVVRLSVAVTVTVTFTVTVWHVSKMGSVKQKYLRGNLVL